MSSPRDSEKALCPVTNHVDKLMFNEIRNLSGSPKHQTVAVKCLPNIFTDMENITVFHCMDIHKIWIFFINRKSLGYHWSSFPLFIWCVLPSHLLSAFFCNGRSERKACNRKGEPVCYCKPGFLKESRIAARAAGQEKLYQKWYVFCGGLASVQVPCWMKYKQWLGAYLKSLGG